MTITIAQVLAEAMAEADAAALPRPFAERRHFSIVVGHLGGICASSRPLSNRTPPILTFPPSTQTASTTSSSP